MEKDKSPVFTSKNYILDGKITDYNELFELTEKKQSVVWQRGRLQPNYKIHPAAFFLHWSLAQLKNTTLYRIKKIK